MTRSIPGYLKREIAGIMIPADEKVEINFKPEKKALYLWLAEANLDFMERINTAQSYQHNFIAMVDEEGHSRGLPWNPRGQFFIGYPAYRPILGNVLIWSEALNEDGMDIVDLASSAVEWLSNPQRAEDYSNWISDPKFQHHFHHHRIAFPQR